MKFSVTPLSISAVSSPCSFKDRNTILSFEALILHIYIKSSEQDTALNLAIGIRHFKNPPEQAAL